ncbi:hypothetical protein GCM10009527_061070 [Actinomadura nitritigenes]|uniref:Integral membrane protein n=1 Tax=Actinomadura nitritigenes TaxID=134602 RepID=A0ABS3R090_9ACTN|nr:hypothetical protein [Actinomadura nitritigenes]MBO2439088.1 hypothetical protein [Actinomadura nitritigenes]
MTKRRSGTSPRSATAPRSRRAAWTLVLVAPAVAELTLGTVPVRMIWLVLLYVPVYGAGVLLIRELVRRLGGGRSSILAMGLVYGLVEEGLALQSLTSPHLYGAAGWGPRPFGVNAPYAELNLPYHAVFSVLVPIALVELVFRRHGRAAYLRRGGLAVTGLVAALGALLLRVLVPPSEDPHYSLPGGAALTILALCAALTVLALGVLPRLPRPPSRGAPPAPRVLGVICGVASFGYLALLFPFAGADHSAFVPRAWAPVPMAAAALLAAATAVPLLRTGGWTDRHRLAAISGALVGHTAFGLVANTGSVPDALGLTVIAAAMVSLLAALGRRLAAPGPAGPVHTTRETR